MSRPRSVLWTGQRVLFTAWLALLALLLPTAFAGTASAQSSSEVTEFALGPVDFSPGPITLGPDGNMWFLDWKGQGETTIKELNRITPAGQITGFRIPGSSGELPSTLTTGPDGNFWYTDRFGQIGRVTLNGEITEFTFDGSVHAIAAGPEGDLWFTETPNAAESAEKVAHMTPAGEVIDRLGTRLTAGASGEKR